MITPLGEPFHLCCTKTYYICNTRSLVTCRLHRNLSFMKFKYQTVLQINIFTPRDAKLELLDAS